MGVTDLCEGVYLLEGGVELNLLFVAGADLLGVLEPTVALEGEPIATLFGLEDGLEFPFGTVLGGESLAVLVLGAEVLGVTPVLEGTVLPVEEVFEILGLEVLGVATLETGLEFLTSFPLF